jgi:hypothetical protein
MKKFETEEDRAREKMVMRRVSRALGLKFRQAETFSPFDGEIADCSGAKPVLVALIEVKCRFVRSDQYPTLIVSARKIDRGRMLAARMGLDYIIACRWQDCIGWTKLMHGEPFPREAIARYDRNDPRDREQGYAIPVKRFNILHEEVTA